MPALDSSGGPLEAASPIDPSAAPLVDLRPFCDRTPYIVNELLPLRRVLRLFKAMGLRHLVVVDSRSRVVGMITRRNLVDAEHGRRIAPECVELGGMSEVWMASLPLSFPSNYLASAHIT